MLNFLRTKTKSWNMNFMDNSIQLFNFPFLAKAREFQTSQDV